MENKEMYFVIWEDPDCYKRINEFSELSQVHEFIFKHVVLENCRVFEGTEISVSLIVEK